MTPQPITVDSFTAAMRAAVNERGADWVYPQDVGANPEWWHALDPGPVCRYFLDDGSPACIIGTALSKLGYGPGDVDEGEGAGTAALPALHGVTSRRHPVNIAADAAQSVQDGGGTWGEALAAYERVIANAQA